MQSSHLLLTLLGLASHGMVNASPVVSNSNAACAAVDPIVDRLHHDPWATPFCLSLLHIPTITITATSTVSDLVTTVDTITESSQTATVTAAIITSIVETDTVTITTCISTSSIILPPRNLPSSTSHSSSSSTRSSSSSSSHSSTHSSTSSSSHSSTSSSSHTSTHSSTSSSSHSSTHSSTSSSSHSSSHSSTPCTTHASTHHSSSSSTHTQSTPSCVASFERSKVTTACSCLSIPTPSTTTTKTITAMPTITSDAIFTPTLTLTPPVVDITVTSTSTVINCPSPAPSLCSNQGLQWAVYPNDFGDNTDTDYTNFDPAYYKTQTPEQDGVTTTIGGINDPQEGEIDIYNSTTPIESVYFALNHRGYIFAQQSGVYTFTFSQVDDAAFLWVGSLASSGWDRDNADLIASEIIVDGGGVAPGSGAYGATFVAGQYYSVRIVFAQAQGAAVFDLTVTAPDGTTFLSSDSSGSPYIVQYSCDGTTAPAYPPFGSET